MLPNKETPKLLGITLDERLDFTRNIAITGAKVMKALNEVEGILKVGTKKVLTGL